MTAVIKVKCQISRSERRAGLLADGFVQGNFVDRFTSEPSGRHVHRGKQQISR